MLPDQQLIVNESCDGEHGRCPLEPGLLVWGRSRGVSPDKNPHKQNRLVWATASFLLRAKCRSILAFQAQGTN